MAYSSDSNIRLGQIPALDPADVRLLPIMQPIHNAIHSLNSSAIGFSQFLTPPGIDDPPEAGFLARIPSFWATCAADVVEGKIVKASPGGWTKGVRGAYYLAEGEALGGAASAKETWPFGFTAEGPIEGKFRIVWPPFLIKIDGVGVGDIGERIYTDGHGDLFIPINRKNEDWAVGLVVGDGIVVIDHRLQR